MENLKLLETQVLVDRLAMYTTLYAKMFREKDKGVEFENTRWIIKDLQKEISRRREQALRRNEFRTGDQMNVEQINR